MWIYGGGEYIDREDQDHEELERVCDIWQKEKNLKKRLIESGMTRLYAVGPSLPKKRGTCKPSARENKIKIK